MYMRKENGKRESPYKGILKFADEKKPQLSFAVVLSVLSSAFGIVPYQTAFARFPLDLK